MQNTRSLMQTLRQELTLQTRHRILLEDQQEALLACDRARFTTLQCEHEKLVLELAAQDAKRRTALTGEDGTQLTFSDLKAQIPTDGRRGLTTLENSLRRTVERIQCLLLRNQELIENELKYFSFTLDLFVEAGRSADNGYGGNGRFPGRLLLDRRA